MILYGVVNTELYTAVLFYSSLEIAKYFANNFENKGRSKIIAISFKDLE